MSGQEIPLSDVPISWDFQLEQQGFIARYGNAGGHYFKQVMLQPNVLVPTYPIKRISEQIYETAKRLASSID